MEDRSECCVQYTRGEKRDKNVKYVSKNDNHFVRPCSLTVYLLIRPKCEWVTRGVTLLHLPPLWQLWHRHFLWHTLWQTEHAPLCLKLTTCSRRAQVAKVAQKAFKVRCALHIQVHEALSRETWKFKKVAKLLKVEGCQHCKHCDRQHGKEPIKD